MVFPETLRRWNLRLIRKYEVATHQFRISDFGFSTHHTTKPLVSFSPFLLFPSAFSGRVGGTF
jgi:hypothetical protein